MMVCELVDLPDGGRAFVCGSRAGKRCPCGNRGVLLCDWKVEGGTCDKPLCRHCTHSPAPEKDLCPTHAAEWKARLAAREKRDA